MSDILEIINEWDPMNFLTHAPDDEYEEEAKLVNELLNATCNSDELADGIYGVFRRMFGNDFRKTREDCQLIAEKLLKSRNR